MRQSTRSSTQRPPGSERVFADDSGRLWSATRTATAVLFFCIGDARRTGRALAVDDAVGEEDLGDETLRAWLEAAPTIGLLS